MSRTLPGGSAESRKAVSAAQVATDGGRCREAQRQQGLLAALHGAAAVEGAHGRAGSVSAPSTALSPGLGLSGLRPGPNDLAEGLSAYRANARAIAARALEAAFPVLHQLIGAEDFAAMAWALWREQPPRRGDLAWFGEELPAWLQAGMDRLDEPYLPDVARLEWAVHRAQFAQDHEGPPQGLHRLAEDDPGTLAARFVPGTALVVSAHPVASIWLAHQPEREAEGDARFAEVRAAFEDRRGEAALAWRSGWRVRVTPLPPPLAGFTRDLLAGESLGTALAAADADFSFEAWLVRALSEGWLAGLQTHCA